MAPPPRLIPAGQQPHPRPTGRRRLPACLHPTAARAQVSSYGSGTSSSGTAVLNDDFDLRKVAGKHVLVVRGWGGLGRAGEGWGGLGRAGEGWGGLGRAVVGCCPRSAAGPAA
jgi:hypothetical protein